MNRQIDRVARGVAVAAVWLASVSALSAAHAQEPSSDPILRIETGGVVALPRDLAVDEASERLYVGGEDKAIRVWRLADLRLLDTWYLPAGDGPEGQVNAVALSPDGSLLAAGGWTGYAWDRALSISVFDTRSGRIVKRITGLPGVIASLQFAHEGTLLLAGLVGRGGLIGVHWPAATLAFHDRDYADTVLGLDTVAGTAAVVALDGRLRVYDLPSGQRRLSVALDEGRVPTLVRIAPNEKRLAIGFYDAPHVGLYALQTGQAVGQLRTAEGMAQRNLVVLDWSADSRQLAAGGDPDDTEKAYLTRWDVASGRTVSRTPVASQRLLNLRVLQDGSAVLLTEEPSVVRLRDNGHVQRTPASGIRDHRRLGASLTTNASGKAVWMSHATDRRQAWSFDLERLRIVDAGPSTIGQPAPGRPPVAPLVHWTQGQASATIGGKAAVLEDHELVRDVAYLPSNDPILGTEYGVRRYHAQGELRWYKPTPGVVWAVRTSGDGRYVIAAVSDGTLRWLRTSDGALALSLFAHAETGEWVAWTPAGYYASSPRGDELIGWQINRSKRERADFYHASQFERLLYRPDIVRAALDDEAGTPRLRSAQGAFEIRDLATIAPPRVDILDLTHAGNAKEPHRMRARIRATRVGGAMKSHVVFVDDVPITPTAARRLSKPEAESFERVIEFAPLVPGGTMRVEVATDQAIGVGQTLLPLNVGPDRPFDKRGDLYVLAIGVREFPRLPKAFELFYTERDAQEVARFFQGQAGKLYRRVHVRVISDAGPIKPTRDAIVKELGFLHNAGPDDTVLLFLASHGVRDAHNNYYFATADSRTDDLCAILHEPDKPVVPHCRDVAISSDPMRSFIEWQVFFDAVGASAGRRLLVVDTCEAGNIGGASEVGSLRKRSASSRFSLMLASGDGESSQEYRAGKHGLFTYAFLRALEGQAQRDADGHLSLERVYEYTKMEVDRLRDRRVGPMTPQLVAPELLRGLPLAHVGERPLSQ